MKKGFTLLELLIVIGILAILAAVVTVVLNPAELLKQARDSQRVSDLASLNSALGMYTADVATLSLGTSGNCYIYGTATTTGCGGRHGSTGTATPNATSSRVVDGTGWIPVNFGVISSGSPLPTLSIDPSNGTTYYYSYAPNTASSTYELNALFESVKYKDTLNLDGNDGGSSTTLYEVGTEPGFDI